MFDPQTAFSEFVFQARLRYLAFKRVVWLAETLFLLCLIAMLTLYGAYSQLLVVATIFQMARVTSAALNHRALAVQFRAPDDNHLA